MTPRSPPRISGRIVTGTVSRLPRPGWSRVAPGWCIRATQRLVCEPVVCSRPDIPVRPVRDSADRHLGSAAPAFPASTSRDPSADPAVPGAGCRSAFALREEQFVTFVDRPLTCVDCGVEFIHSAADQEFYSQQGFSSEPKRCTSCRASRRAARDNGYDVQDIGGPRGYERGDDRPNREYFAVMLLVVRQSGPGPVQAAHGPPGLLLGLLPAGPPGLTGRRIRNRSASGPQTRGAFDSGPGARGVMPPSPRTYRRRPRRASPARIVTAREGYRASIRAGWPLRARFEDSLASPGPRLGRDERGLPLPGRPYSRKEYPRG